jgi:hypothetical protein
MTERKLAMTEEEIAMTERKLIMTDKGWPITHATRHCEETEADAAIYPSLRGESVALDVAVSLSPHYFFVPHQQSFLSLG